LIASKKLRLMYFSDKALRSVAVNWLGDSQETFARIKYRAHVITGFPSW
jgi:hypothetical protein